MVEVALYVYLNSNFYLNFKIIVVNLSKLLSNVQYKILVQENILVVPLQMLLHLLILDLIQTLVAANQIVVWV